MECVTKNPSKRPDPAEKIKVLRAGGQYLKNDLIDTMIFLEEFQVRFITWYIFASVFFFKTKMA